MPKLKLTRTAIEKLKPDPTRDTLYWDTGTRGLGLRVTKGGVFSFICQGRVRGTTKDVRLTIGTYGAWQLEDAQRKADYYRQLFEGGNREVGFWSARHVDDAVRCECLVGGRYVAAVESVDPDPFVVGDFHCCCESSVPDVG